MFTDLMKKVFVAIICTVCLVVFSTYLNTVFSHLRQLVHDVNDVQSKSEYEIGILLHQKINQMIDSGKESTELQVSEREILKIVGMFLDNKEFRDELFRILHDPDHERLKAHFHNALQTLHEFYDFKVNCTYSLFEILKYFLTHR